MKKTIIIMSKVPYLGSVKTRLQPDLTQAQSKDLATCFLQDTETRIQTFGCETIISFSPPNLKSDLVKLLKYDHILIPQKGSDLGERMSGAFQFAFDNGSDLVSMIGTDSPTMPAYVIERTFAMLAGKSDVVLGKTEDGGFYLIGCKTMEKSIFTSVNWSSEKTFEQTERNILAAGLELGLVKSCYDVDYPSDLLRLRKELERESDMAPKTSEWLKKN